MCNIMTMSGWARDTLYGFEESRLPLESSTCEFTDEDHMKGVISRSSRTYNFWLGESAAGKGLGGEIFQGMCSYFMNTGSNDQRFRPTNPHGCPLEPPRAYGWRTGGVRHRTGR